MFYNLVINNYFENLSNSERNLENLDQIILVIDENLFSDDLEIINRNLLDSRLAITNYKNLKNVIRIYNDFIVLNVGQRINRDELINILDGFGYSCSLDIIQPMSYQIRGSIVDINSSIPVRLEFDDDIIESIRIFDINTLLSLKKLNSVKISSTNKSSYKAKVLNIIFITLEEIEIVENILSREIREIERKEGISIEWFLQKVETNLRRIYNLSQVINLENYKFIFSNHKIYQDFLYYCKKKRLDMNNFSNYEIRNSESIFGFIDDSKRIVFLTSKEFVSGESSKNIFIHQNIIDSIEEFKEGDLVVVEGYGIGIYLGIQKLKVCHYPEKEFIVVQFKNNRKMYFSIESVSLHKYLSSESVNKKLKERILSIPSFKSWQKKLEKVYGEIKEIGDNILSINAKRLCTSSFKLLPGSIDLEVEKSFEYTLTEDQEKVLNEVLLDLQSGIPTNRLILADTGYGKTEIILRAIARTLSNNYKAILFVPTTILAYQHYFNIKDRLVGKKVCIYTSIFRNSRLLLEGDLLIATPFDITKLDFEDKEKVALVVIDEEHLMGAVFKEKLKEVFVKAHFLYSSATPIPRTYFMAKTGIIDISIINTPPPTYKSPKTLILTYNSFKHKLLLLEKIIKKSLEMNLKVIYVNNDIDQLYEIWSYLPSGTSIIHAKLKPKQIEKNFIDFINGKNNIILCTTIIQSGIDTPEFDVIIIDNSHTLGISQLYQLRGRVGRGSKNPYCYIFLDEKYFNTSTYERISIFEKEDLSNIDIVQKDLDLRGPGSILSKKQSGHLEQIGLIQFVKMINQYLNKDDDLPSVECDEPTYLPESPIKNKLYRKLLVIKDLDEFEVIKKEIIDVYGKDLPLPTINLLKLIEYRIKNKGKKRKMRVKIVNGKVIEV